MTKVILKAISPIRYPASALDRNTCHAYGSAYRFWYPVIIFTATGDDKGYPWLSWWQFQYIALDILITVITLREKKNVSIACECGGRSCPSERLPSFYRHSFDRGAAVWEVRLAFTQPGQIIPGYRLSSSSLTPRVATAWWNCQSL